MDNEIRQLLEDIRARPGIYLGEKSVTRLGAFIDGYLYGKTQKGMFASKILTGYQQFVRDRYKVVESRRWDRILLSSEGSENLAFDRSFVLLDEYLDQNKEQ